MSLTIIDKTKFKPNLALDMVGECIKHYQRFKRPIETIVLSPKMWDMWKSGIIDQSPELEDDLNYFNQMIFRPKYDGVGSELVVKKGSDFMIKKMDVILKEKVLA